MKTALVCGARGFIGAHLVKRLKREGFWVRDVDLKFPEFAKSETGDFIIADLRNQQTCASIIDRRFDEVFQLAADMGGAGYIFTGDHDAAIMHNSATINLNVVEMCKNRAIKRIFYSSSACIYPAHNQTDPDDPLTCEDSAYPAIPDSEYGWEKSFGERLSFGRPSSSLFAGLERTYPWIARQVMMARGSNSHPTIATPSSRPQLVTKCCRPS